MPSTATIRRILGHHGLITPQPRKRPHSSYHRFAAEQPNQCWQSDFTHWRLADGTDVEILNWLDDHSRYLISVTAHPRVTGDIVVQTFQGACTLHGIPQSTLTDNGFVFTTRFRGSPNRFEVLLAKLGVTQKNGSPNHPQTQGKVERLNQTLKKWLAARPAAEDVVELQHLLDRFTDYYNHRRKHRSLNRCTPAQAYTARAKATPDPNSRSHYRIRDDTVHASGSVTLRRRTHAPHQTRRRPHRRPRPHAHPRPTRPRDQPRHRRNHPRTDHQPRQRQPTPRRQTRTTPRTPKRRHAERLQIPQEINMSRDSR